MATPSGRRLPTTIEEYEAAWARVDLEEVREKGLAFQPCPTDVIISPYSKSGTTWLQQIVHGLRSGGSMDFEEISSVVPWIETAGAIGIELDAPQEGPFRAFKSHLDYSRVPKGARYIVSLRHPYDVALSFYHFMEGWFFEPHTITLSEMVQSDMLVREAGRSYWGHLASWWRQRQQPNVLLLTFEAMKADLPAAVRKIAAFVGIDLDPELERTVLAQASYSFMREHVHQFDDHILAEVFNRMAGLPVGNSDKVYAGRTGAGRDQLPDALKAELDARWEKEIGRTLGLPNYQAVREALEREG